MCMGLLEICEYTYPHLYIYTSSTSHKFSVPPYTPSFISFCLCFFTSCLLQLLHSRAVGVTCVDSAACGDGDAGRCGLLLTLLHLLVSLGGLSQHVPRLIQQDR